MGELIGRCGVCKKRLTLANSYEKNSLLYCCSCNMRAVRNSNQKTIRKYKNERKRDKKEEW